MFIPYFSSLALRLCLSLGLSLGQAASGQIRHEVVVTATRLETPAREVASAVTVLTKEDLDRAQRTTVFEALEDSAGLSLLRNGGPGEASAVFIRGTNSEHALIMLDGVPLNDPINPSRSFDLAHLTLDGVERIEVLRGPQSPLYGSDALGGAINILTARGRGRPRLGLRLAGGTYHTLEGGLDLQGSSGVFHYAFALSRSSTNGISAASSSYPGNTENDAYRNTTLSGRFGAGFNGGAEIDLVIRGVSSRADIDNFGGQFGDDPNNVQDYSSYLVRVQGRVLLAGGRWEQKIGFSAVRSERKNENPADPDHPFDTERGRFQSSLVRVDWQNNLFVHSTQTLTFGADLERETGESEYFSESLWGPSESLFPRRRADRAGVYFQDQIKIGGRFFGTAGLRYDRHGRAGEALTFRLAPAYLIERTGTKLKATIGTGFKAPSLFQLYAPATAWGPIGNPNLEPERSLGWDAGFEQPLWTGAVSFGLSYFRNELKNLIDFDYALGYVNVGRSRMEGIEATAEARPDESFVVRLSYTRLDARDLTHDLPLPRRPKDRLTACVQWAFAGRWDAGLSAIYTGPRRDRDYTSWPAGEVTLKGFLLLGANVSFDLKTGFQVFARLDNILDARYETVFGYGSPGFTATAGLRLVI
jgi:vitamin B12 transporter